MSDFESVANAIRRRRSVKSFDGREVPRAFVEKLIDLAVMAPNHHMTEPWYFYCLSRSGVEKFLAHMQSKLGAEEKAALEPAMKRMQTAGAVLVVTCLKSPEVFRHLEDYAAVSAAIENILIAASAEGIQSFWSTGKVTRHPEALRYLGVPETQELVGALWLGYGPLQGGPERKRTREQTRWFE